MLQLWTYNILIFMILCQNLSYTIHFYSILTDMEIHKRERYKECPMFIKGRAEDLAPNLAEHHVSQRLEDWSLHCNIQPESSDVNSFWNQVNAEPEIL